MRAGEALLTDHVARFNAGGRSGDCGPMVDGFTEDAELVFEGIRVGRDDANGKGAGSGPG